MERFLSSPPPFLLFLSLFFLNLHQFLCGFSFSWRNTFTPFVFRANPLSLSLMRHLAAISTPRLRIDCPHQSPLKLWSFVCDTTSSGKVYLSFVSLHFLSLGKRVVLSFLSRRLTDVSLQQGPRWKATLFRFTRISWKHFAGVVFDDVRNPNFVFVLKFPSVVL